MGETDAGAMSAGGGAAVRLSASAVALMVAASATALALHLTGGGSSTASPRPGSELQVAGSSTLPGQVAVANSASPSEEDTCAPHVSTSSPASPTSTTVTASTPTSSATRGPITYVVKRGDNLTVIAAWFHQHGYGDLYERNKAVIGDDPNLILVGQRITISSAGASVTP